MRWPLFAVVVNNFDACNYEPARGGGGEKGGEQEGIGVAGAEEATSIAGVAREQFDGKSSKVRGATGDAEATRVVRGLAADGESSRLSW